MSQNCAPHSAQHSGLPCPKEVRPTQCDVKVIFIGASNIDGVILHHDLPPRHTVNAAYYCTAPPSSSDQEKTTTLGSTEPYHFHDNARSHTVAAVTDLFAAGNGRFWNIHRTHPDMSPCDYDLFAKVKELLRGTRYNIRDEVICGIGRLIAEYQQRWTR